MKIIRFARYRTADVLWALFATVLLLGSPALGFAQEPPPAQPTTPTTPGDDAFAARQRAWDAIRNPVYPSAGPNIRPGPNLDFTPPPSCDSSCSVSTAQCFATCPGGRALDRISPAAGGRNPALASCQSACVTSHASCTIGCSKLRPNPPTSRPPTPPGPNPPRPVPAPEAAPQNFAESLASPAASSSTSATDTTASTVSTLNDPGTP